MTGAEDTCVLTETPERDGWGAWQKHYGVRSSLPVAVPGGDRLRGVPGARHGDGLGLSVLATTHVRRGDVLPSPIALPLVLVFRLRILKERRRARGALLVHIPEVRAETDPGTGGS